MDNWMVSIDISAEQRRYVVEVSASSVFTSMCDADSEAGADAEAEAGAGAEVGSDVTPCSPLERRAPSGAACSTPIARD